MLKVYQYDIIDDKKRDIVLSILAGVQAETYAQRVIEEYYDSAMAELEKIELSSWARNNFEETPFLRTFWYTRLIRGLPNREKPKLSI